MCVVSMVSDYYMNPVPGRIMVKFLAKAALAIAMISASPAIAQTKPHAAPAKLTSTQAQKNPLLLLGQFSLDDLQAALADAQAQNPPDVIAANCYSALIAALQSPLANPIPTKPGLFLLFQKSRDLKNMVAAMQSNSGPLTAINIGCAPLIMDSQATLIRLGILSGALVAIP